VAVQAQRTMEVSSWCSRRARLGGFFPLFTRRLRNYHLRAWQLSHPAVFEPWFSRRGASLLSSLAHRGGCCLTPHSTGRATAGHLGPVGGTLYIFANRAKASCLRAPVNSNVRQHKRGSAVLQQGQRLRRELNSHEAAAPKDVASWEPEWPILVAKPKTEDEIPGLRPGTAHSGTTLAPPYQPDLPFLLGGLGLQVLRAAVSTAAAGFSSGGCGSSSKSRSARFASAELEAQRSGHQQESALL